MTKIELLYENEEGNGVKKKYFDALKKVKKQLMGFYDLDKKRRLQLVDKINKDIFNDIQINQYENIITFSSEIDTYIRKTAYLAIGKNI